MVGKAPKGRPVNQELRTLGNLARTLAEVLGPQADINDMVELSRQSTQAAKGGRLAEALLATGAAAVAPAMAFFPGSIGGIIRNSTGKRWFRGMSGELRGKDVGSFTFWTDNPTEASAYSYGSALTNKGDYPNVIPANMRENMVGRNIDDEIIEALMDDLDIDKVARDIIEREGLDFVEFYHPNAVDMASDEHLVRLVKNPSDIKF